MGPDFVARLPVKKFLGVGPATAAKMERLGIETGADLRENPRGSARRAFGRADLDAGIPAPTPQPTPWAGAQAVTTAAYGQIIAAPQRDRLDIFLATANTTAMIFGAAPSFDDIMASAGQIEKVQIGSHSTAIASDEDDDTNASCHYWPAKRWEIIGVQRIAPAAALRGPARYARSCGPASVPRVAFALRARCERQQPRFLPSVDAVVRKNDKGLSKPACRDPRTRKRHVALRTRNQRFGCSTSTYGPRHFAMHQKTWSFRVGWMRSPAE